MRDWKSLSIPIWGVDGVVVVDMCNMLCKLVNIEKSELIRTPPE
jgi:hypothetical protein